MLNLFYRQRRRLILFAVLTCLPLSILTLIGMWEDLRYVGWGEIYIMLQLLGVIMAIVCAALMILPTVVVIFAPRWRGAIEGMFLAIVLAVPATLIVRPFLGIGFVLQYQFAVECVVIFVLLYLRVIDRVLPKLRYKARRSYFSYKSANDLWAQHVPEPQFTDQHWDKKLTELSIDWQDPTVINARYTLPKVELNQRMNVTRNDAPYEYAYRFHSETAQNIAGGSGTYSISIADQDYRRLVTLTLKSEKLPFTHWFGLWLGDVLGDQVDYLVAVESGQTDYSVTGAQMRKLSRPQTGSISPSARPA